jgi:hypothetical protein
MASTAARPISIRVAEKPRTETIALTLIAVAVAIAHLLTNSRYGFHRDEFQFLSDARHLDWGYVAYPPFTPFVERISLGIFGLSMVGLRLASVIAQSIAIVVTGLMARELGGGKLAQIAAALSVALSALPLFQGTEFQYTTFDYLWWVLIAWCVIRLLQSENPRWWLAIGAIAGIGLMTKYLILFYILSVLAGFLLTRARRYFLNRYFLAALALTVLICLPNLLWQVHHHFISYQFLQSIHKRDVGEGRAKGFVSQQFWICTNLFAAPLWMAGLIAFLRSSRYRVLAFMYLLPMAFLFLSKARGYYLAAAYPMLIAMGAVVGETWLARLNTGWRRTVELAFFTGLAGFGAYICAIVLPIASSGPLMHFALNNNGDLREETGWPQIVQQVAAIRHALPPEQRANVGILVRNYGEQGAIEMLGPAYHLPPPISGTNSAWLRGYPSPPPSTLIVLGLSQHYADKTLEGCRLVGHVVNPYGVENEESRDHPDIFVCGGPRQPWPEFWKDYQSFG